MIVNRAIDTARALTPRSLGLRLRARRARPRRPLVVVPPMLGIRLRDPRGRRLWGWTRNLFRGPDVSTCEDAVPDGLLDRFRLVPGIYARDVYGSMIDYLARVGGYRVGRDVFVFEYDWRRGIAHAAARLAERIEALGEVDLVCASSGGLVARYCLLYGGRDGADPGDEIARRVGRVVYVGTPQRGTIEALSIATHGLCFVSGIGRRHPPAEALRCQILYDLLPHPDDAVAVDEHHRPVAVDLYDARVWRELGIHAGAPPDLAAKLERAHGLHRALDRPGPSVDAIVIGARHLDTRARFVVERGRADVPECLDCAGAAARPLAEPGDGSVTLASLTALPGVGPERVRFVEPRIHHDLPSDPTVHVRIVESLFERASA